MEKVRVRLIRKLAQMIDGVDLSNRSVGNTFQVPAEQARLLVAERWAVPVDSASSSSSESRSPERSPSREEAEPSFS